MKEIFGLPVVADEGTLLWVYQLFDTHGGKHWPVGSNGTKEDTPLADPFSTHPEFEGYLFSTAPLRHHLEKCLETAPAINANKLAGRSGTKLVCSIGHHLSPWSQYYILNLSLT
jgi:hypothetical protein